VDFIRIMLPDVQVTLKDEVIGEDGIGLRCEVTGTHTGDVPGIPASGNEVAWEQAVFFYTAAGKLVELSTSFDSEHWLAQLGVVSPP
jgi:predicted ester cyclase